MNNREEGGDGGQKEMKEEKRMFYLDGHLSHKDGGEDIVGDCEKHPLLVQKMTIKRVKEEHDSNFLHPPEQIFVALLRYSPLNLKAEVQRAAER